MNQIDSVIAATIQYAREASGSADGELFRRVAAAYLSGVLSSAQALAAADGVHPSKLAQAARLAGEKMLGVKSTPLNPLGESALPEAEQVAPGRVVRDTGDLFFTANTAACEKPIAGPIPPGKVHVTFVRYRTLEWDEGSEEFDNKAFSVHDLSCPEARLIAAQARE